MTKPTEEEFKQALQVLKAYAPERFLNIKPLEGKRNHPDGYYLIRNDGYFQIASNLTGELVCCNIFLRIDDSIDRVLSVIGKFHVQAGEVI